jgi:hypothetical protein
LHLHQDPSRNAVLLAQALEGSPRAWLRQFGARNVLGIAAGAIAAHNLHALMSWRERETVVRRLAAHE